jgi:hypothetical protein
MSQDDSTSERLRRQREQLSRRKEEVRQDLERVERTGRLQSAPDDGGEDDSLLVQCELPSAEPCHVEQIIDQKPAS